MRDHPTVTVQRRWLALIAICCAISLICHVISGIAC